MELECLCGLEVERQETAVCLENGDGARALTPDISTRRTSERIRAIVICAGSGKERDEVCRVLMGGNDDDLVRRGTVDASNL